MTLGVVASGRRATVRAAVGLAVSVLLVLGASCGGSKYRFDSGAVRPLGDQCPKARSAMADLIAGIQGDAISVLIPLTTDEQLRADISLLQSARGDTTLMQSPEGRGAAEDIRQWIRLACPPIGAKTTTKPTA